MEGKTLTPYPHRFHPPLGSRSYRRRYSALKGKDLLLFKPLSWKHTQCTIGSFGGSGCCGSSSSLDGGCIKWKEITTWLPFSLCQLESLSPWSLSTILPRTKMLTSWLTSLSSGGGVSSGGESMMIWVILTMITSFKLRNKEDFRKFPSLILIDTRKTSISKREYLILIPWS